LKSELPLINLSKSKPEKVRKDCNFRIDLSLLAQSLPFQDSWLRTSEAAQLSFFPLSSIPALSLKGQKEQPLL
jgi:hypothetical protein